MYNNRGLSYNCPVGLGEQTQVRLTAWMICLVQIKVINMIPDSSLNTGLIAKRKGEGRNYI